SADSGMLFYNEELFEKYGIEERPSPDWDLEDMYRVSAEITDASGGDVYGISTPIGDSTAYFLFYPTLRAYGGNIYDPKTEQFVFADDASLEAWEEMLRPYTEEFGTPYSMVLNKTANLFESGQVAMIINSRAQVVAYRE